MRFPVSSADRLKVPVSLLPGFRKLSTTLPQPVDSSQVRASLHDDADAIDAGLLRLLGERRGEEAASQGAEKGAPVYYWSHPRPESSKGTIGAQPRRSDRQRARRGSLKRAASSPSGGRICAVPDLLRRAACADWHQLDTA